MKQVNIQLNLEDNQVFDKTVTGIIKGKVREIVRNECLDIVEQEAKREVQRLLSGDSLGYRNKLSTMIKDEKLIFDINNEGYNAFIEVELPLRYKANVYHK